MVADLLNHIGVEVASIALEAIANGEGVLKATKDLTNDIIDTSLAKLEVLVVSIGALVDGLDPAVVASGGSVINVVLELDDVGVGDVIRIDSAQDGSGVAVDSFSAERRSLGEGRQRESGDGAHGVGDMGCQTSARDGRQGTAGKKAEQ